MMMYLSIWLFGAICGAVAMLIFFCIANHQ